MKALVVSIICTLTLLGTNLHAQSTAIVVGGEGSELLPEGIIRGDGCSEYGGTGAALLDTFNVYYQPNGEGDYVDNLFPDPEVYSFEMNIPEGLPEYQSMGKHGSFWDSRGREGDGELPWINENWREGRYYDHRYNPTGDEPWFGVLDTMPQWTINYWDVFEEDSTQMFFIHTVLAGTVKDYLYDEETGNATALLELFEICYKGYNDNGEPGPGLIEFEGGSYQGFDSFREASGRLDFPAFFFEWNGEEQTGVLTPCGTKVQRIRHDGWIMGYYDIIQEAIDYAHMGETILMQPGIYEESIFFHDTSLTLGSLWLTTGDPVYIESTIIDGDREGSVIAISNVDEDGCLLEGFTIRNGYADSGAGLRLNDVNIALRNMIIAGNHAVSRGGGAYFTECDESVIEDVIFTENRCERDGGGLMIYNTDDAVLENVVIDGNEAEYRGGGLFLWDCEDTQISNSKVIENYSDAIAAGIYSDNETILDNVLVAGNSARGIGGAITGQAATYNITNCTIFDNSALVESVFSNVVPSTFNIVNCIIRSFNGQPVGTECRAVSVAYCDIESGPDFFENVNFDVVEWGDGNIDEDPLFVNPGDGDFHLFHNSPCIDAGDPDSPEDPDETCADMGAYYFHQWGPQIEVPGDFETIQYAIDAAMEADTILVHPGSYMECIDFSGKDIVLGSLYLTSGDTAYIDSTVIDGDLMNTVVNFEGGETEAAKLVGFSIINGSSQENGGGICCANSSPTIEFCYIENNSAQTRGGGMSCEPDAHPMISNCVVTSNSAGSGGGGIWCGEGSHPAISKCYIGDNTAGWNGGGINLYNGCEPRIEECVIFLNTAGSRGGGIIVSQDCNPVIKDCSISSNYADVNGGGVAVERAANPVIDHCLLLGNMCEQGGGWVLSAESGSKVEYSNNTTTWMAIYGTTFAMQCTASDVILMNSIIWGDSPLSITVGNDTTGSGRLIVTNSDIFGGGGSVDLDEESELIWLDGNIDEDPEFVSLYDGDYNLNAGSPCVDSGISQFVWEDETLLDIPGEEYLGNAPDMGALESEFSDVESGNVNLPDEITLYPCFPNPFNSTTTISYSLPVASQVSLKVFDLSGREVKSLLEGRIEAGKHTVSLNGDEMASGVYMVRMEAGEREHVRKVLLVR